MKKLICFLIGICLTFLATSTQAQDQKPDALKALQQRAEAAGQRAAAATVEANEINMIGYRRKLNGKTGLQLYVVFLSRSGQPIDYFVTDGKCVSSTKRLTPSYELVDTGPNSVLIDAPSEDGTHGKSSPYVYCKTVDGKYKQWNGRYYASDAPIELTIKPIMIDPSGRNQQQQ